MFQARRFPAEWPRAPVEWEWTLDLSLIRDYGSGERLALVLCFLVGLGLLEGFLGALGVEGLDVEVFDVDVETMDVLLVDVF